MDEEFGQNGFLAPFALLTPDEAAALLGLFRRLWAPDRMLWSKGFAITDPAYFAIAADARLLARLRALIGDDIVLWGASLVVRRPGQIHRWHVDVESADPRGGFASVWLGLEGVTAKSGLKFIAGSHTMGTPVQHLIAETGEPDTDTAVLGLARARRPGAVIESPPLTDGSAIIFDGRVWHASHNAEPKAVRTALLLQYARADRPVRQPAGGYRRRFDHGAGQPAPCLVVSGSALSEPNRLEPPPPIRPRMLENCIHSLAPALAHAQPRFRAFSYFRGGTPVLAEIECHASVLPPGGSPHPPHAHAEEEILLVLEGQATLVLGDSADAALAERTTIGPGQFVYYPARRFHTIENAAAEPVRYLMFKWTSPPLRDGDRLTTQVVDYAAAAASDPERSRRSQPVLDAATGWLDRLKAHVTIMRPGAGYRSHRDAHDVAIVLLEGEIDSLGRRIAAPALLFHPAGQPHGLKATGDAPARYLVFEFHRSTRLDVANLARLRAFRFSRTGYAVVRRGFHRLIAALRGR